MNTLEKDFLERLKVVEEHNQDDPKAWHVHAESVMLNFLTAAGYSEFANEYARQSGNWGYV